MSSAFSNTPPIKGTNSVTFTTTGNYIGKFRIVVVADGKAFYSDYASLALAANYNMVTSNNTAELNISDNILEITKTPNPSSYGKTAFATNIGGSSIRAYAVMPTGMTKYDYGAWPTFRTKVLPDLHLFGAITGTISTFATGGDYGMSALSTSNTKPVNYSFNRAFVWPFAQNYTATQNEDVEFQIGIWGQSPLSIETTDTINLVGKISHPITVQETDPLGNTVEYTDTNVLAEKELTNLRSHLQGRSATTLLPKFEFKFEHVSGNTDWEIDSPTGTAKNTWFKPTKSSRVVFPDARTAKSYTVKISVRLADNPATVMENNLTININ